MAGIKGKTGVYKRSPKQIEDLRTRISLVREKITKESRLKQAESMKGKKNALGHIVSLESRKKISDKLIGIPLDDVRYEKATTTLRRERYMLGCTGENHPSWKGGKPKCKTCDNRISYNKEYCMKCAGKLRRTNVEKQERNNSTYGDWRKSVRDRDGWKCKMSNGDCLGKVVAHHILPWAKFPELRYDVNNGITLCHFHHPKRREDEMRLSPYFQEMILSKVI